LDWSKLQAYKLWHQGQLQWTGLPTEFHKKIYSLVHKLLEETDRQNRDPISLTFLSNESSVKWKKGHVQKQRTFTGHGKRVKEGESAEVARNV
jgi:hypothetical protein